MGFSLPNIASATNAAKNFVTKKLENINLVGNGLVKNVSGGLGQLQNKVPGIPGYPGAKSKPVPGKVVTEIDNKKDIDINGELFSGRDLAYIERKPGEPFPNELSQFDSYNCIFTLSVLNGNSINFPDETYRRDILGPIIVKSGGTGDILNSDAIKLKNFKSKANPSGRYDAFIDNIKISGIIGYNKASGNTNSTAISFQITEPYSTGLFFQAVQVAAWEAGYDNWLSMPMLLSIEFKGHLTANQQNVRAKLSRKHIPLKVNAIEMRVSGQGTVYDCSAIPWNEATFSVDNNLISSTVSIEGGTVQEMLQTGTEDNRLSLQSVINQRLKEVADKANIDPDRILILFPTDLQTGKNATNSDDNSRLPGATKSPALTSTDSDKLVFAKLGVELDYDNLIQPIANPIGKSPMGFEQDVKRAEAIFAKEDAIYDEKTGTWTRGDMQISKTKGIAKFSQGTSITDAINEVILASDYGRRALDKNNIDKDQKVTWWKIETQFYILSTSKKLKGNARNPTLSVFRVIPYKIDYSNFVQGSQPAKKVEEKKMNAVKKYEYLYTGKNIDIIDFSIEFKTSFYQALNADSGKNNESVQQNLAEEVKEDNGKYVDTERDAADIFGVSTADETNYTPGQAQTKVITKYSEVSMDAKRGGVTAGEDASTIAARQFNKALNDGSDMIGLNMKILGDPFYIADSGVGNYTAKSTNVPEMNSDGAINTQDGEVYVVVNFRNPIDLNPNEGLYDFGGKGRLVPEFSGLYRIFQFESMFEKNIFTQQLKLVRMMHQDLKPTESTDNAPAKSAFTPKDG
jgi:hypothetical protein